MDFGEALDLLKNDQFLTRAGWNGKGMWISVRRPLDPYMREYIQMSTVDGTLVPWVASQTDLLAEDWEVFE